MSDFDHDMLKLQLAMAQAQTEATNGQSLSMKFQKLANGLLVPQSVEPVPVPAYGQSPLVKYYQMAHDEKRQALLRDWQKAFVGVDWATEQKSIHEEYAYQQQVHQELMGEFAPPSKPTPPKPAPVKPFQAQPAGPIPYVLKGYVVWQTADAKFVLAPANMPMSLDYCRVYHRDSCPGLALMPMDTPLSSAAPGKTLGLASGSSSGPLAWICRSSTRGR